MTTMTTTQAELCNQNVIGRRDTQLREVAVKVVTAIVLPSPH